MPVVRVDSALDVLTSVVGSIRARTDTRPWVQPFGAMVGAGGRGGGPTLHVHGRVLSGAPPELDPRTLPERLRATWRRWETDELPGAVVHASACGAEGSARAEHEGYFRLTLPLGGDAAVVAPSIPVTLLTPGGEAFRVSATVPGRDARFAVISDVDDTALVAHATNRLRQAVNLYLREARERQAVDGMPRLYRALARGDEQAPRHNPFAYVSSCPANLLAVVGEALRCNGFPEGPLHLPDVGFGDDQWIKAGHLEHKATCIDRLLDMWAPLPAILFGDTGQADPEVFEHVVAARPGRVRAVFLRDAPGGDAARADAAVERLRRAGVRAARFSRTDVVTAELAALGWWHGPAARA
jgi:phosphatidate phosphatase APP1